MVSSTIFLRISCKENEFMLYKDRPVIDNSDLLPVGGGAQREIVSPVNKHCEIRTTGSKRPNRVLGGGIWVSQRPSKKKNLNQAESARQYAHKVDRSKDGGRNRNSA